MSCRAAQASFRGLRRALAAFFMLSAVGWAGDCGPGCGLDHCRLYLDSVGSGVRYRNDKDVCPASSPMRIRHNLVFAVLFWELISLVQD